MTAKEEFISIYKENIKREGADKLLEFLQKSDFFTAPSSTRYHGAYEGGLVQHSVNVYHCLHYFCFGWSWHPSLYQRQRILWRLRVFLSS